MDKYKEILHDKQNAVSEDGDVVPYFESFDNDYEPDFEPYETTVTKGASSELGARAINFLKVMDAYNQQSKHRGIRTASQFEDFKRRYGSKSEDVVGGVASKAYEASRKAQESIDDLVGVEELSKAGFSIREIQDLKKEIKQELDSKFGPGAGNYAVRKKASSKLIKSAIISRKSSKSL